MPIHEQKSNHLFSATQNNLERSDARNYNSLDLNYLNGLFNENHKSGHKLIKFHLNLEGSTLKHSIKLLPGKEIYSEG